MRPLNRAGCTVDLTVIPSSGIYSVHRHDQTRHKVLGHIPVGCTADPEVVLLGGIHAYPQQIGTIHQAFGHIPTGCTVYPAVVPFGGMHVVPLVGPVIHQVSVCSPVGLLLFPRSFNPEAVHQDLAENCQEGATQQVREPPQQYHCNQSYQIHRTLCPHDGTPRCAAILVSAGACQLVSVTWQQIVPAGLAIAGCSDGGSSVEPASSGLPLA